MVPLIGAALLVALHAVARRRFADALADRDRGRRHGPVPVAPEGLDRPACRLLVRRLAIRGSIVLGVGFVIDPIGAGMATVCAALVTAAFVFTWHYFEAVGVLFHSLLLVFLAAICGFCLSGDVFNMFVYFELMSVAA